MITVQVNNIEKKFNQSITLEELLLQLNINLNGIAVAVNNLVVAKNLWVTTQLNNNDNILIIQSTQGG